MTATPWLVVLIVRVFALNRMMTQIQGVERTVIAAIRVGVDETKMVMLYACPMPLVVKVVAGQLDHGLWSGVIREHIIVHCPIHLLLVQRGRVHRFVRAIMNVMRRSVRSV